MVGEAEKASDECLTKVLSNHYTQGFVTRYLSGEKKLTTVDSGFCQLYSDEKSTLLPLSKQWYATKVHLYMFED